MGFKLPSNVPVKLVKIPELNMEVGVWSFIAPIVGAAQVGILVRMNGETEFTCPAFKLYSTEDKLEKVINEQFGGNELEWFKSILPELIAKFIEWLKTTFGWGPSGTAGQLTQAQIDALPSVIDRINHTIQNNLTMTVDSTGKTVTFVVK